MEIGEVKSSSGYGKPPWIFKGSALYQLHLVKAETARACIPKEFRLVEAFGYTLGGFFLASYDDSPAGVFDELVVIAGLAWNRPPSFRQFFQSCAWATSVYVNSDEACDHGRKVFGLPSQLARFSKRKTAVSTSRQPTKGRKSTGILNMNGIDATLCYKSDPADVQVIDTTDMCKISLTSAVPGVNFPHWMSPAIRMSLPSFSGGTKYNPNFLKYSCQIECRVRAVRPLKVSVAFSNRTTNDERDQSLEEHHHHGDGGGSHNNNIERQNLCSCVMLSKPILALKLSHMKMQVEAPEVLSQSSNSLDTSHTPVP